jgi:hypothetical protein
MLMPCNQEEILEMLKLRASVLRSSPGEGGFSSSETKHDKTMASGPKLFPSPRKLKEQRPQPRKSVLASSPYENVFCTLETNDSRTWMRPKLFLSARRIE